MAVLSLITDFQGNTISCDGVTTNTNDQHLIGCSMKGVERR